MGRKFRWNSVNYCLFSWWPSTPIEDGISFTRVMIERIRVSTKLMSCAHVAGWFPQPPQQSAIDSYALRNDAITFEFTTFHVPSTMGFMSLSSTGVVATTSFHINAVIRHPQRNAVLVRCMCLWHKPVPRHITWANTSESLYSTRN